MRRSTPKSLPRRRKPAVRNHGGKRNIVIDPKSMPALSRALSVAEKSQLAATMRASAESR
jgi:hypothetical protein